MKFTFVNKDGREWFNNADIPDHEENDLKVFVTDADTKKCHAEDSDGFEGWGATLKESLVNLNYQRTEMHWDNDISMFLKKLPAIHYR